MNLEVWAGWTSVITPIPQRWIEFCLCCSTHKSSTFKQIQTNKTKTIYMLRIRTYLFSYFGFMLWFLKRKTHIFSCTRPQMHTKWWHFSLLKRKPFSLPHRERSGHKSGNTKREGERQWVGGLIILWGVKNIKKCNPSKRCTQK